MSEYCHAEYKGFCRRRTFRNDRNYATRIPKIDMSTISVQMPESLKKSIEEIAAREGYSLSQFVASAAAEKLAAVKTVDYLRNEAAQGRREDFDHYLAAVPKATPPSEDRID